MREEMQKRMDKENNHYQRRGSLFRSDIQVKFYKAPEKANLLDILAYETGKFDPIGPGEFASTLRVFIHRGAAQDGGDIICIEQTFRDKKRRDELFGSNSFCPVCKEYRKKVAAGATKEETDALRYGNWPRTIYNVFDRRNPGEGGQIWETSAYLLQQYLESISKKSILPGEAQTFENNIPYMDWEEGKSIAFDRQGMDEKTKFIGIKFEDRRSAIPDEVIKNVKPLDELIAWPTVASAYEAFWGVPYEGEASNPPERAAKHKKEEPKKEKEPEPEPKKEEPKKEPEPEDEEAKMVRQLEEIRKKKEAAKQSAKKEESKKEPAKASTSGGDCPSGYQFGVDIDEKSECADCPKWTECAKDADRREREGSK
jgi:hypothetical protein